MENNLTIPGWEDEEYKAFTEKFKAKKTTDDCYTPETVYSAIAGWVEEEYRLHQENFVRPFFPGGDFETYPYGAESVVVDNPPFSILTRILKYYERAGIRYFLFAPALTLFSNAGSVQGTYLPVGVSITYDNGAQVATSFVTNLEPGRLRARTAPELYRRVKEADDENRRKTAKTVPKYSYPDNIVTAAMMQRWSRYGVEYELRRTEALAISALEAQKAKGITIFGGGFLTGTRAAAERAAAERAAAERAAAERWTLSETEKEIVSYIDKKTNQED